MRDLDVTIWDANGSLVRWRGTRRTATKLRFSSGLPGGFLQCSFVIEQPAARLLPLHAGQVVRVQRGMTTCWWGWIEDVETLQHGWIDRVSVQALGPWQQLQERLSSPEYTDTVSSAILATEMALYCDDISRDTSQIADSAVPLTIDWAHKSISEIAKLVCDTGNSAQLPLLFAIWEPAGSRTLLGSTANLTHDYQLEQQGVEWYFLIGREDSTFDSVYVHSGCYAAAFADDENDAIASIDKLPVAGSTAYILEYWHYWSAHSGMTVNGRIDWYNASDVFISSSYLTTYTAAGAASSWSQRRDSVTSPSTAAAARVMVEVDNNGASKYTCVDDIRFYLSVTSLAADTAPRAYLWSRDLSTYDYVLRSAAIDPGLQSTSTTRDMANAVVASYGSSSYTAWAEDTASQSVYRRRDHVVSAGSVGSVDAAAQRDVYLTKHAAPGTEMQGFRISRPGAIRTSQGLAVDPALLRAGDRLKIVDGRLADSVIMLEQVEWNDGTATCKPENYEDVTRMLARL